MARGHVPEVDRLYNNATYHSRYTANSTISDIWVIDIIQSRIEFTWNSIKNSLIYNIEVGML